MSDFIIGDPHLSFGCNKPMDIFNGWTNHTELLKKNWNSTVTQNDTVLIAGDISWAMTADEAKPDLDFINALNGRKIIMKGNHDYWWQSMKKLCDYKTENSLDTIEFMFNNAYETPERIFCGTRGWQVIGDTRNDEDKKIMDREAGRFSLSLAAASVLPGYGKKKLTAVFHYPPVFDRFVFESLFEQMKKYGIGECYFGHLHGKIRQQAAHTVVDGVECSLISADYLNFLPHKLT